MFSTEGFGSYVTDGEFADVRVVVSSKGYPVHMVLLASASSYFADTFRKLDAQKPIFRRTTSIGSPTLGTLRGTSSPSPPAPIVANSQEVTSSPTTTHEHKHHSHSHKRHNRHTHSSHPAPSSQPTLSQSTVFLNGETPNSTQKTETVLCTLISHTPTQLPVVELPIVDPDNVFPLILEYVYGLPITVTLDNAIPLLSMSNQLAITSLGRTVAMFIANHITSDNAIKMLKKALELQSTYTTTNPTTDDVISKCVLILARNFSDLVNTKGESIFNALPINVVLDVLRHGSLAVEAECHVYAVVCTYLGNVPQSASVDYHELATTLYETVRFPYLDYDHLSHAMQNPWVPRSMLAEGVVYRLLNFEVSPSVHVESLPSRIAPRPAFARIFEYSYDFDKRGVLYYLATNGCVDEWRNPAATKRIKVTASSTEKGSCQTIGDLVPSEWWTADVPASWVQVALQHGFVVVPTYYSLRHGSNSKHDCLRNWVLQGSNDGNSWTTLRRHTNDMSINSNYATHSWPVQGTEPFQFFRVLQTGRNSSNHNFLSLSGFELYGDLHRLTAAASASTLQLAPTPAPTPVSSNSSITGTSPPQTPPQAPSGLTLGKKSS